LETIVKTEVISKDKDGTLEKVYFQKEARTVKKDDGTEETKLVEPWELRATGRKTHELRGAFKESGREMFQEGLKEWDQAGGDLKITRPDGSVDTIRADKESIYRQQPGFCQTRIRPGITMPQMPWHKPCGHSRHQECHCEGENVDG
jgi:hypothetical protein